MTTYLAHLLKPYSKRPLEPAQGQKPLDFAAGGLTGSVNTDGRLVAINTYDPTYGMITLTSAPPFPEDQRYDAARVRAYRQSLTALDGFGLTFRHEITSSQSFLVEDVIPYTSLTLANGIIADCITFAPRNAQGEVIQLWAFSEAGGWARLSGRMWLQRAAYTQLTEGGPATMPPVDTDPVRDTQDMATIGLSNPAVHWNVFFSSGTHLRDNPDGSVSFDAAMLRDGDDDDWIYPQIIREGMHIPGIGLRTPDETVPPITETFFHFRYRRDGDGSARHGRYNLPQIRTLLIDTLDLWRDRWHGWRLSGQYHPSTDAALKRGIAYSVACCIPVEPEATCIITDHMLLPLAWNRDAYYVARGLLLWNDDTAPVVRQHLRWTFEVAERMDGAWGRSYLANGAIKDHGYQLDQQIFPFLELADYTLLTGQTVTYTRLRPQISAWLDGLLEHRLDDGRYLFPTEETPADDPIAYPYHFSSHLLLWHTLTQLSHIENTVDGYDLNALAAHVRAAIDAHFITAHNGETIYAYATDGDGNHHLYHDANDIPLAYAPSWGFCPADDPTWLATVDFAFSAANIGGAVAGKLGSVHTPDAPWPLGDMQELIIARTIGDSAREAQVRARIAWSAQWDGALPEAYDATTGAVRSRHWFAWPNAMLACIDLDPTAPTQSQNTTHPIRLRNGLRKRNTPMNIGFISTRLAGVDGVSLETTKLVQVFEEMGHQCFYIAGQLDSDTKPGWLVPSMHFYDPIAKQIHDEVFANPEPSPRTFRRIYGIADSIRSELMAFIEEYNIDLIVPQNASTIPMNISLGVAIAETIKRLRIKTICHHHDFYWERDRFINNGIQDILDTAFPPDLEPIRHLTINTVMQRRLKAWRGIESVYLPNVFDFDNPPPPPDDYAMTFRTELGLSEDDLIMLQPTRIVRRKAIEKAIELMRKLDDDRLILLITGYEGDEPGGYGDWLREEAERSGIRYQFIGPYVGAVRAEVDGHKVYTLWDIYPHAHMITYPSVYEGFGNALIETVYFRKPFIVHRYGAYLSDIAPAGIRAVEFWHDLTDDVLAQVRELIDNPALREEMTEHNYRVGLEHFSFQVLRRTLKQVLNSFNTKTQYVAL